ncbi:hypothetical protein Q8F55_007869 [Vanrija albida]|uniref:Protein kinase regulator n=1 Tax=Vanrija albida TaxID=181172 RepID=A0ABR3PUQ8_9TREE
MMETTTRSPLTTPILEWDESIVSQYFAGLHLSYKEDAIYEHGITGDVLCHLDMAGLLEFGIPSIGHRLQVLRGVFELKKEQGVDMEEDDWRPQEDVTLEASQTQMKIEQMWNLIQDQQERLHMLESEHNRLRKAITKYGIPLEQDNPTPSIRAEDVNGTPHTAIPYTFDSPRELNGPHSAIPKLVHMSTLTPRPGNKGFVPPLPLPEVRPGLLRANSDVVKPISKIPSSPTPPTEVIKPTPTRPAKSKDVTMSAEGAAKSFRVTMEDPCWRVLPAALKKYKINDDWRVYALFICYANTERCLSYDEKPLLLFQKLKDNGQRPVFMLRHIRDIKSPIAVAQQKQATKLGLPPNQTTKNLLPTIESTAGSPTTPAGNGTARAAPANGDQPSGRTPNAGTFPELPSPGMRDKDEVPQDTQPGTVVDREGNVHSVTYALSIYPYIADRTDEFDVAVGATFVVMQKAKGWWFVQKDPEGAGKIVSDPLRAAWVPAGCLLEMSAPVQSVSPRSPGRFPGRAPIRPSSIMSSSYPGVVLMDYVAKDENELSLKEGQKIRVYKKYCHWSYSIMEETGERGWAPAWFIGKLSGDKAVEGITSPVPRERGNGNGDTPLATTPALGSAAPSAATATAVSPVAEVHEEK